MSGELIVSMASPPKNFDASLAARQAPKDSSNCRTGPACEAAYLFLRRVSSFHRNAGLAVTLARRRLLQGENAIDPAARERTPTDLKSAREEDACIVRLRNRQLVPISLPSSSCHLPFFFGETHSIRGA